MQHLHNYYSRSITRADLGVVRPHATVIPHGAPTAPHPNYINNFIIILLNALCSIVLLKPFHVFFINLVGPLSPRAPKHCFFCFYVNPPLSITNIMSCPISILVCHVLYIFLQYKPLCYRPSVTLFYKPLCSI